MTFSGNFMPRRFGAGGRKLEVGKIAYSPDYKTPAPKLKPVKQ